MITIRCFVIFFPLVFVCGFDQASAAPAGQLLNASGNVQAFSITDPARPIVAGAGIEPSMSIITGSNSSAFLKFHDRQSVVLQSNSLFRVREYHYDPASAAAGLLAFELV